MSNSSGNPYLRKTIDNTEKKDHVRVTSTCAVPSNTHLTSSYTYVSAVDGCGPSSLQSNRKRVFPSTHTELEPPEYPLNGHHSLSKAPRAEVTVDGCPHSPSHNNDSNPSTSAAIKLSRP
jgi:hypothetical protein